MLRSDDGIAANPTAVYLPKSHTLLMHYDCSGGNHGPICGGSAYGRTFQLTSTGECQLISTPDPVTVL